MTVPLFPAAVLWDYDGTLVDTQPVWIQVERDIAALYDKVWSDEQGFAAIGISAERAAQMLVDLIGEPTLDVEAMVRLRSTMVAQRVARRDLNFRPGARYLIQDLADKGIPCGLVSASARFVLAAGLSRMPANWFATTICGDEISSPKPDPQGYLLAAAALGVDPQSCLVIEDSGPGCLAGLASGAAVLAVPCMTPLDPRPGQVLLDSLALTDAGGLAAIYAQARASAG